MKSKVSKGLTIENREARHNYFIEDTLECGIALRGNEVKSIRAGKVSIKEAWIDIENIELLLKGMHISKWDTANTFDVDERRNRILLAHKKEISDLNKQIQQQGYTLIPLKVYINDKGRVKVLIGVCKGKKNYDKRQTEKERASKRDIERALKR